MKKKLHLFIITIILLGNSCKKKAKDEIVPSPQITSISPTEGAPGSEVIIKGNYFSDSSNDIKVLFDNLMIPITAINDTSIRIKIPLDAVEGIYKIHIEMNEIKSVEDFTFNIIKPLHTITNFNPTSEEIGSIITIKGTGFGSTPIVKFNGTTATLEPGNTDTEIKVKVPAGASSGKISVTVNGKTIESTNDFTVITYQIKAISPQQGKVGNLITITGIGFGNSPIVKFNGTTATLEPGNTDTEIKVKVPAGASSGKISITVNGKTIESTNDFTVITYQIETVTPTSGRVNDIVTITGIGFGNSPIVKFNGTTATLEPGNTDTEIKVKVPAGASSGKISITVNGKTIESATNFILNPAIMSLNVNTGRIGTYVEITADNLNTDINNIKVLFGTIEATKVSLIGNKLSVISPAPLTPASTVQVSITITGGMKSNEMAFTYQSSPVILEEIMGAMVGENIYCDQNGDIYTSKNSIVYLLKAGSTMWNTINITPGISGTYDIMKYGSNLYLPAYNRVYKVAIETGTSSDFVTGANSPLINDRFFGGSSDNQGNIYLPGYDKFNLIKISNNGSTIEAIYSKTGKKFFSTPTLLGNYLFLPYVDTEDGDKKKILKLNLSTGTPDAMFSYDTGGFDISGISSYNNKLYLLLRGKGLVEVNTDTGSSSTIFSFVGSTGNNGKKISINPSTGILYFTDGTKAYRFYLK